MRIGVTSFTFQGHVSSSSRDHLVSRTQLPIGGPLEPSLYLLTISEIFSGKCDAMVDTTLI